MKHLVFILAFIAAPLGVFSQSEILIDARPTSMGYCSSSDNECNGAITSIAGQDVSSYLLRISFKKNEIIRLKLYRNGELIEHIYSDGFSSVRLSKKSFYVSCNYFQWNGLFHHPESDVNHIFLVDISPKKKKGKVSFHYPEESKIYIYHFDLL